VSRSTMIRVESSMASSLRGHLALGRPGEKLAKKRIFPRWQGADKNHTGGAAGNDFFPVQFIAFELFRRWVAIDHHQLYLGVGGYLHVGGVEQVIADFNFDQWRRGQHLRGNS